MTKRTTKQEKTETIHQSKPQKTFDPLELRGYSLPLGKRTLIMGILNVTPDSFSDGGQFTEVEKALLHGKKMVEEGADIIDIGGESTRPGAVKVEEEEELQRVMPMVKALVEALEVPISIDTYKAPVAKAALEAGVHMINDVWGLQRDKEMASVVASFGVPVCIMHNQEGTEYKEDILSSIKTFFEKSLTMARKAGIDDKNILLDPGIGFGKTPEQNIYVMGRLQELQEFGYPVLLGTSRKSMIGKILDLAPEQRIEGTLATNVIGVYQGVEIIRVHDIKENLRGIKVADAILRGVEHG
ncbi:dihydropteroate synthase [Tindallia magadiensis]|uniref:Dihydropteroate synthase n=2 Tax=Tindallia magadiensis TaxID=69895 RepID=A0A1I3GJ34_9FIRM|nr:dihydropteroate synthase [Tindallia magadiensis]SFI23437.1 dihydropteroate synthase [Tindallia magadiensis]